MTNSLHAWKYSMLLSSADCIQNDFFIKSNSEIPSVSNSLDLDQACLGSWSLSRSKLHRLQAFS